MARHAQVFQNILPNFRLAPMVSVMDDIVSIPRGAERPIYLSREWHALRAAEAAAAPVSVVGGPTTAAYTLKPSSASSYSNEQYSDERRRSSHGWTSTPPPAACGQSTGTCFAWTICCAATVGRLLSGRLHSIAAVWIKRRGWRRIPSRSGLWASPTHARAAGDEGQEAVQARRSIGRQQLAQALASLTTARLGPPPDRKTVPGTRAGTCAPPILGRRRRNLGAGGRLPRMAGSAHQSSGRPPGTRSAPAAPVRLSGRRAATARGAAYERGSYGIATWLFRVENPIGKCRGARHNRISSGDHSRVFRRRRWRRHQELRQIDGDLQIGAQPEILKRAARAFKETCTAALFANFVARFFKLIWERFSSLAT